DEERARKAVALELVADEADPELLRLVRETAEDAKVVAGGGQETPSRPPLLAALHVDGEVDTCGAARRDVGLRHLPSGPGRAGGRDDRAACEHGAEDVRDAYGRPPVPEGGHHARLARPDGFRVGGENRGPRGAAEVVRALADRDRTLRVLAERD